MLSRLTISNYALIDHADIEFDSPFTIITGETGAGKSIMLSALGMILGDRTDIKSVRQEGRSIMVEAEFTNPPEGLLSEFDLSDEEVAATLIIRRQIAPNGRSRAFVNDIPVSQKVLREVGLRLIDIHSQHANLIISDKARQLAMLDSVAGNAAEREAYSAAFREYVELRSRIARMRREREQNKQDEEFLRFQYEQLEKIQPKSGELEGLERQYDILSDAEQIKENLQRASFALSEADESALSLISDARSALAGVNLDLFKDYKDADGLRERMESAYLELRDIAETVSGMASDVEINPTELERTESRISTLYDAMRRFKAESDAELYDYYMELGHKLGNLSGSDDEIAALEPKLKTLGKRLKETADRLSESRSAAADSFAEKLVALARDLGLANIKFSAMLSRGKFSASGQDEVEFLCTFNKNQPMRPVAEIASGGEISRLMLSIKAIVSEMQNLPTIIFDEIDTGVSGEIADKMGAMMNRMARFRQVIAITHLPQVASQGDEQLKVFKTDSDTKTITNITRLSEDERVTEIAKMLSGSTLADAAIENARALLARRQPHK